VCGAPCLALRSSFAARCVHQNQGYWEPTLETMARVIVAAAGFDRLGCRSGRRGHTGRG